MANSPPLKINNMNTTLNEIKKHDPCTEGWVKLLKYLNKTEADDEILHLRTILDSNGLDDCLWALRAVIGHEKEIRLMAADFAESVLYIYEKVHPQDLRPRKAIQAACDYANGFIDSDALDAARAAARDAASAAASAAARAAASDAAWVAACNAARDAAWAAARAAEREKQKQILLKYI